MRANVPELLFRSRNDLRTWLKENSETSDGIWLVFGKIKDIITITANEALEEALCFGWIDGQMQSVDNTKYLKYFAKRRPKSVWSEKNKKTVESLREKGLMTDLGEKAIENAKKNGTWNVPKEDPITNEQVDAFVERLVGISPAYENFKKMSPSVQRTYTRRYLSFKSEASQQKDLEKIIDRLNQGLKPM